MVHPDHDAVPSNKQLFRNLAGWWKSKQESLQAGPGYVPSHQHVYIWRQLVDISCDRCTALYRELSFFTPTVDLPANLTINGYSYYVACGLGCAYIDDGKVYLTVNYLNADNGASAAIQYITKDDCTTLSNAKEVDANGSNFASIGSQKQTKAAPGLRGQSFDVIYGQVCAPAPRS